MKLNATLRRISYFLLIYEADSKQISMLLSNVPEDLENICMEAGQCRESSDYNTFSVTELFDQLPFPGFDDECGRSIARLERITWRLQKAQSRTAVSAVKNVHRVFTGCGCTRNVRFPDSELTRAFNLAYVPKHDCNDCNCVSRGWWNSSVWFLYEIPGAIMNNSWSLAQLFTTRNFVHKVQEQINFALILSKAILLLHLCYWLHKRIRSHNVLFFAPNVEKIDLSLPFLAGFEFSRSEEPDPVTEIPGAVAEFNLDRHPDCQGLPVEFVLNQNRGCVKL
jgi:hypothetical protein